jgi:hypothetical protein
MSGIEDAGDHRIRRARCRGDSGLKLEPRGGKALYDPYAGIMVITPCEGAGVVKLWLKREKPAPARAETG